MINSLLSFGAKSVKPDILEQTLTLRKETVNEIEKNCVNKTNNVSTWQALIIATRGSGKTHIIKVLYHRLKSNNKINNKSVIAYMSEDEVGIANFTDLMVSILRAFIRYGELGSDKIETQISEASLIKDSNKREIFVKDILNKFVDKRIIILLIENFDKILKSLGQQGQRSLRDFIHQYNNLSIIATSQNLIANLQDSKNPFYNFFNIFQLKKLDFEGTIEFLEAIATSEGNKLLVNEINKPALEGKLRAIYKLTEGNHRLLVTFYSFLKADFKSELSGIFIKVMNDLKPYYEQFVNALPAQQQKIIKHLSLNRGATSGKEIAIACFIDPNVISKQFSLLFEKGMIDKNKSGKDVFYELKEPLMRICFEISENPDGISSLFVDFLSAYYDGKIIKEQYLMFKYGARFQNKDVKTKYEYEAKMYSLVLSELEQEKISFAHKVFDKIDNYKELVSTIHSLNTGKLEQIDLSYESFRKGNVFIEKKQYEEAIKHYQKAAKLYPANDNLYSQIGFAHGVQGKYKEALNNFQKAVELNPENEGAFHGLGIAFSNLKQYREAIVVYQKVVELNPENDGAYFNEGNAFLKLKQYKEAIEAYQKSVELNPENEDAFYLLGIAFSILEQNIEAIGAYQKSVELNPENEGAFYGLGAAFLNLKQNKEAIEAYQKAVELDPENEGAFFELGIAFSNLEQYKDAIKAYQKAVELNPENEGAFFELGIAFSNLEQYKEAIEAYQKAVALNPKNDAAYFNEGNAFLNLKRDKEAIEAYQKAVELNPENESAFLGLGIAFSNLKQYKESIEACQKAIKINPNNDNSYNSLGLDYLITNKVDHAFETFHKGLEINPANMYTNFSLLGSYVRINDQNKSKELIIKLIRKVNNDFLTISLNEDVFYNLFRFGSDTFINLYFGFILKLMLKEKKDKQMWKSLTDSLFVILIKIEDYEKERLNNIEKTLTGMLTEYKESVILMKMFRVGVAYLKNKEKNAIFKLSKEERKLFKEAVLDERDQ